MRLALINIIVYVILIIIFNIILKHFHADYVNRIITIITLSTIYLILIQADKR